MQMMLVWRGKGFLRSERVSIYDIDNKPKLRMMLVCEGERVSFGELRSTLPPGFSLIKHLLRQFLSLSYFLIACLFV